MATTVDSGFSVLLSRLTPTGTESSAAVAHRASIKACLDSNFGTLDAYFRSGSFGNGTSVSGYSDVDYMAAISAVKTPAASQTLLTNVNAALDKRFPKTGVHIEAPAVVVPFGTEKSETTEVTPGSLVKKIGDHRVFKISDRAGGWMLTSPDAHNAYVQAQDTRLYGKVKPLVRFIKAWKFYNGLSISSFYLEMFVAKFCSTESAIIYDMDVRSVLRKLKESELADIADPAGVSGTISAGSVGTRLLASLNLASVVPHAERAVALRESDVKAAFSAWDGVFANRFPLYV